MKAKALLIGCLLAALTGTEAYADMVVLSGSDVASDSNISAPGIVFGDGLQADSTSGIYSAHSWTLGPSTLPDPDNLNYFAFSLDANSGYEIDFDSFDLNVQTENKGPQTLVLRSSIDDFSSDISVIEFTTSNTAANFSVDLSGSQFQNLTDSVTFRLYGYDTGNNGGKLSINDYSFVGVVETEGSLSAVPEPQSLALIGVGSLLMFGYMKRRQNGTAF